MKNNFGFGKTVDMSFDEAIDEVTVLPNPKLFFMRLSP